MEWISLEDRVSPKDNENIIYLIDGNYALDDVDDAILTLNYTTRHFYRPVGKWTDPYYGEVTHMMILPQD